MKKILISVISVLLLNTGCKNNTGHGNVDMGDAIIIKFPKEENAELKNKFSLESYFIPMETTEKSLLGEVKILKVKEDNVFMSDKQKVVCYKIDDKMSQGKINYCINSIGKGPGEYNEIVDISYNNKYLFIYDINKVIFYEIETGKFIRSIKLDFAAREMAALDDYLLFFTTYGQNHPEYNFEIIALDTKTNKRYKYFKHPKKYLGLWDGRQLSKYGSIVYYCPPFRNIVYKFNDKAKPVTYALSNCYDNNKKVDLYAFDNIKSQNELKNGDYFYLFNNLQIVKDYIGIQFFHKGKSRRVWYNIKKQTAFKTGASYLPEAIYNNMIISPVDSYKIAEYNPQDFKNNQPVLKMYSKVLNVNENDNPCLLVKKIQHE